MPFKWKPLPAMVLLSSLVVLATSQFGCGDARHADKAAAPNPPSPTLQITRSSPLDLEIGGELRDVPAGATRYVTRPDLLALPQVNSYVSDDPNFGRSVRIEGVQLEELARRVAAAGDSALVVAICDDLYRAHYPRAYMSAHHPVLVLTINHAGPQDWPKNSEDPGMGIGPFLISHAKFAPSFHVLSHADEPQIPWGVVRLEFRDEKEVFGAIAPRGPHANEEPVKAGYRIAEQNCFRCHNMGAWATASPQRFASYVRSPQAVNPNAEMPAFPEYDDATMAALRAYFTTFTDATADGKKP